MCATCPSLTREMIENQGIPLEEALRILRQYLPRTSILVGQSIGKDVDWLQLREGQDYQASGSPCPHAGCITCQCQQCGYSLDSPAPSVHVLWGSALVVVTKMSSVLISFDQFRRHA